MFLLENRVSKRERLQEKEAAPTPAPGGRHPEIPHVGGASGPGGQGTEPGEGCGGRQGRGLRPASGFLRGSLQKTVHPEQDAESLS